MRRMEISTKVKILEQAHHAIDAELRESHSSAELQKACVLQADWRQSSEAEQPATTHQMFAK